MLNYYGWINTLSILERKKEKKNMNIYSFINSIPDYVSNPLTAINVTIMISSLKDKFGDKIHETTYEGYLAIQDMSPYKYYKLCLWYWCDECTYGIRECTAKDFNIKEEDEMDISKMSKEDALNAIDELKKYVEKCEEKEKEIPRMYRGLLPEAQPVIVCPWRKGENTPLWWKDVTEVMTFNEDDTFLTWGVLAYELAQLMYAREYLKVDVKELLEEHKYGYVVFKLIYDITECKYVIVNVSRYQTLNERDYVWCFTDKEDSEKVRDYMNKYVAYVKKNMF